ncbi:hypothetical protein Tco_1424154 [Tanacetum coccineum]
MNAKLTWIHEKYNHRSKTHIGGSSSQTHEIGDVIPYCEELHQLHLDEETLRETLEEQTMNEKARGEKIMQKQVDDDEYFMEFEVMRIDSDYEWIPISLNENDPWEYSLDIDDSDLHLTLVLQYSLIAYVLNHLPTPNPVRIIPGPAGLVQRAKLLKENVFILDHDGAIMSTQEYMQKVVEDVGEDSDFNNGAWVSATNYVNAFGGTVTGVWETSNFLKWKT